MDIVLYIGALVLVIWSQSAVQGAYRKYKDVQIEQRITGYQVAKKILDEHNLSDVKIEYATGILSDHYDPKTNTVRLSEAIYDGSSVASVAVAAHEVGHAVQHAEGYAGIKMRDAILPAAIISSKLGWGVLFIGLFSGLDSLFYLGIGALVVIAIFQLVTLPVEFNASSRALTYLDSMGIVNEYEHDDAKKMLSAAAFTYVAALVSTLAQILRMVLLRSNRD